jgi:sugar phosphate isomerase/epimerase
MQRRTALEILGSLLAVPFARSSEAATSNPDGWKTAVGMNGFSSSSTKYGKTYPIWEVLDFISKSGFKGIEWVEGWPMGGYPRSGEPGRIDALRRMTDAYGLQIFSIQTGASDAFSPDKAAREQWLAGFRDHAAFAKAAGCDCIGMWPGGGLRGQSIDQAIERLCASFRQAAVIAGELGLIAAFEIEPPFAFNTEDHMRRILAGAGESGLKVIYDPSHFDLMNGSTGRPHEMLARIGPSHVGYVQFTDTDGTLRDGGTSKHLACGDGHVDITKSFETLWEGGFRGWVMIDAWEIPDPCDACLKGKKAIDAFLAGRG